MTTQTLSSFPPRLTKKQQKNKLIYKKISKTKTLMLHRFNLGTFCKKVSKHNIHRYLVG